MQKNKLLSSLVVPFVGLSLLASCSTNQKPTNEEFTISYQESANYTVELDATSAKYNSVVNFSVDLTSVFYTIDSVTIDNVEVKSNLSGYYFTMPSNDVMINIKLSPITEYDNLEDNLSFGKSVINKLSLPSPDESLDFPIYQEIPLVFENISSASLILSIQKTIYSSDTSVIPLEAIEFEAVTASNSNVIIGGKLKIDLTKVKKGKSTIYLDLKPNNSKLGTLMKDFEVVDYHTIELDSYTTTLKFTNNSSYSLENIQFSFSDNNIIYGCSDNVNNSKFFKLSDLTDLSYTFNFHANHTYNINAIGLGESPIDLSIAEWVGSGSTESGFNQIQQFRNQYGYYYYTLEIINNNVTVEVVIDD